MGPGRADLGDLATAGFPAVWRNRAYGAFRRALASDAPPEACRGCSLYRRTF